MRPKKENDKITFVDQEKGIFAYTDYTEDLWNKIKETNWHKNGEYLYCSKLGMYLHRFVMANWYGEDVLMDFTDKKFVVDHIDNDGFNCEISNLQFVHEDENKTKGFSYDKKRLECTSSFALNFFKDFATGFYQITIAFNEIFLINMGETNIPIVKLYLLYDDDSSRVLFDSLTMLNELKKEKTIDFSRLGYRDIKFQEDNYMKVKPEDRDKAIVEVDGELYMNLSSKKIRFIKIQPDKKLYSDNYKHE